MTTAPLRILCVEDNELVAGALERKLARSEGFEWLGWARDAHSLFEMATSGRPDVVCMDLDIPGQDTFAMIRELSARFPLTRVLMLSGHLRDDDIQRAVDAGAWGYLSKGEDSNIIVAGIRQVAAGEFVMGTIAKAFFGSVPQKTPLAEPRPSGFTSPLRVISRLFRRRSPQN